MQQMYISTPQSLGCARDFYGCNVHTSLSKLGQVSDYSSLQSSIGDHCDGVLLRVLLFVARNMDRSQNIHVFAKVWPPHCVAPAYAGHAYHWLPDTPSLLEFAITRILGMSGM